MNKIYPQWLNSDKLTKSEKEELTKLTPQEIDAYFSEQPLVFGTAGVRGKMGMGTQRMNRFTYGQLASAYALYIQAKFPDPRVVIGHDNRHNSDKFAELCADILSSYGIKVLLFKHNHLMPTPIISYAIRQTKSSGGIIITASHNPKEYNGFKIYNPDGGQVLPKVVDEITINFEKQDNIINYKFHPNRHLISQMDNKLIKRYFTDALSALVNTGFINVQKDYPIVFTGHHGTSSKLLPKFLKSLKFNIKPVRSQCFYDAEFTNSPISNPETIDSFAASFAYANSLNAKICIGVDPDADRMAIAIKKDGQ
jgi:phosphomannomutase